MAGGSTAGLDREVVIAGGGPTGLMLAGELALAGVDVVVVEPRLDHHVESSRAGGLLSRTIEVLDQRGIAERFVEAGQVIPSQGYAGILLDVGDFPSRHNYVLALWQSRFEPILAEWVAGLGVPILRGRHVTGLTDAGDEVDVALSDGATIRAQYLAGCDGGRSAVRRAAGIEFAGWDPSTSWMIAEVDFAEDPPLGMRYDEDGIQAMGPAADGTSVRIVVTEPVLGEGVPSLAELRGALRRVYGTDFGLRGASWISRFTDAARQATSYRAGRVLLAGDAAHVHSPHGGQGLNTGVQDAVNLGWKLAQVVRGTSPPELLDTYHAERHPVGARVLRNTMAQVALSGGGERHQALRDAVADLLGLDEPRRRIAAMLAGLDIAYTTGPEAGPAGRHPLVGRRVPDLDLRAGGSPTRVYDLLHAAAPVLLRRAGVEGPATPTSATHIRHVEAAYAETAELPVVGEVTMPDAVLIRPDGHVAWAGEPDQSDLVSTLHHWFGSP